MVISTLGKLTLVWSTPIVVLPNPSTVATIKIHLIKIGKYHLVAIFCQCPNLRAVVILIQNIFH